MVKRGQEMHIGADKGKRGMENGNAVVEGATVRGVLRWLEEKE